jgi:uncharacterized membrane protein
MIRTARAVLFVSLALWTGGLATISFVVAPTAFRTAPSRKDAGTMVGATLRTFNKVEVGCGALSLAAALYLYLKRPEGTKKGRLTVVLVFVMLIVSVSLMAWVYPDAAVARVKLESMPDDVITKDYFALIHRISVILVSVNICVGTGLLICNASRKNDGA